VVLFWQPQKKEKKTTISYQRDGSGIRSHDENRGVGSTTHTENSAPAKGKPAGESGNNWPYEGKKKNSSILREGHVEGEPPRDQKMEKGVGNTRQRRENQKESRFAEEPVKKKRHILRKDPSKSGKS